MGAIVAHITSIPNSKSGRGMNDQSLLSSKRFLMSEDDFESLAGVIQDLKIWDDRRYELKCELIAVFETPDSQLPPDVQAAVDLMGEMRDHLNSVLAILDRRMHPLLDLMSEHAIESEK